ncbi:MAG TPA: hypothetical protein VHU17_21910 [Acidimicrobiales bacterium]|jgi:hypothetical protein|nr:hypothetical protein [Acidimicrobiales bacterium]
MSERPRPDGQSSPDVPDVGLDVPGRALDFPDDPAVAVVLHQVPEFETAYLDLVTTFDDAPGGPAVFTELADFVAFRLTALEADRPVLERTLRAIELVADGQDSESAELVGYAFLDSLSPIDRDRIRPWLGPRTRSLLDELNGGGLLGDEAEPPD